MSSIGSRYDETGNSEASGDEILRNEETGSFNQPEAGSKNQHDESSMKVDETDVDGASQPQRLINAQVQAQNFLTDKKIFELFNFLIGHLLVDEPDDPIEYLYNLLHRCMLFRSGLTEPPLLFGTRHIKSLFQSLDPSSMGDISIDQYRMGLETLGITKYEKKPNESTPGRVDRNTFTNEAKCCLIKMLSEIIGKSN